ncbi:MAG: RloB domain-containing protein [Candidatus Moranbacteria bacterium]|nr:RloB domain-containing protein [Candidatus Moranbacteria bacterium]
MVVIFGWVLLGIFAFIGFCVSVFLVWFYLEFRSHRAFAIETAKRHLAIELDSYDRTREEVSSRVSADVLADFDSQVKATKERSEAIIREMTSLRSYFDGFDTDRNLPKKQIAVGENTRRILDLTGNLMHAGETGTKAE